VRESRLVVVRKLLARRVRDEIGSRAVLGIAPDVPQIEEVTDLLLKRSRIALNEVYDVVCEGRIVGRIMLTNVPAPYWSWTLAYRFHEGRTPTRGHEATIEAAMQAFAKSWRRE